MADDIIVTDEALEDPLILRRLLQDIIERLGNEVNEVSNAVSAAALLAMQTQLNSLQSQVNALIITCAAGGDTVTYGTWVPVVSDGTNDCTMVNQTGTWMKVGKAVFITCFCSFSSAGSASGAARITGLTHTAANINAGHDYPLSVGEATSHATAADNSVIVAQVENDSNYITLHHWDDGGGADTNSLTVAQLSINGTLRLNGVYEAAV